MNYAHAIGCVVCASLLLATAVYAEILGVEPGTSSNPKDNVPKEIQRSTPGGATFGPGGSGPGTRSDELVDMKKEKAEPVTLDELKKNVERTHGGASAVAAEKLKEESIRGAKSDKAHKPTGTSATRSDGPKYDPQGFRQLNSDKTLQGQDLVNEQAMDKQPPANRPARERGAR